MDEYVEILLWGEWDEFRGSIHVTWIHGPIQYRIQLSRHMQMNSRIHGSILGVNSSTKSSIKITNCRICKYIDEFVAQFNGSITSKVSVRILTVCRNSFVRRVRWIQGSIHVTWVHGSIQYRIQFRIV